MTTYDEEVDSRVKIILFLARLNLDTLEKHIKSATIFTHYIII